MPEQRSELDKLREALDASSSEDSAESSDGVRNLARALAATPDDDHERYQAQMAEMVEAELRGERIAQLYPEAVAHMDVCESCALEYAELIDVMLALERDFAVETTSSPYLARLGVVLRLNDWFSANMQAMLENLLPRDASSIQQLLPSFLERLPQLPALAAPRQAQAAALAFSGEGDGPFPLMLATWATTEAITDQYTAAQLGEMAAQGALVGTVRDVADRTARAMKLDRKLRSQFVDQYVASVQRDPDAFTALGKNE